MKYNLVGIDGNAFSVMGYVINAMKECNFSKEERDSYFKNATSSDYSHLLFVSIKAIDKCNEVADSAFNS